MVIDGICTHFNISYKKTFPLAVRLVSCYLLLQYITDSGGGKIKCPGVSVSAPAAPPAPEKCATVNKICHVMFSSVLSLTDNREQIHLNTKILGLTIHFK